jgi:hypothetical protein
MEEICSYETYNELQEYLMSQRSRPQSTSSQSWETQNLLEVITLTALLAADDCK